MASVFSPFIGYYLDKFGKRTDVILFSSILNFVAHLMFLNFPICPSPENKCTKAYFIIPLILMGIIHSLLESIIYIPIICESNMVGTGYGIFYSMLNIGDL